MLFVKRLLLLVGVKQIIEAPMNVIAIIRQFVSYYAFRKQSTTRKDLEVSVSDISLVLNESTAATSYDKHYVYHTAWAARALRKYHPQSHIDISSSLQFVAIVSAFVDITFYDYRPPLIKLPGLKVDKVDLLNLPFQDNSIRSLSCMHVVEHIGLGRYGEPLDANGDVKAIRELKRVLAEGGTLFFVVPLGQPRVCFNNCRVYSYEQIVNYFKPLRVHGFAFVNGPDEGDDGLLIPEKPQEYVKSKSYGCGCFEIVK